MVAYLAGVSLLVTALPGPALPILIGFAVNTLSLSYLFYFFQHTLLQHTLSEQISEQIVEATIENPIGVIDVTSSLFLNATDDLPDNETMPVATSLVI